MKRRRHTPQQIVRKLAEGDELLDQGQSIEDVCRSLEGTDLAQRAYPVRQHQGRRREMTARARKENPRLKRIRADQALTSDMLRELNWGNL